jgi:nucleoside-diphosphate-sugar epimerase
VVNANIKAAFTDIEDSNFGQLYNIGNSKNYSVNDIAKMISEKVIYIEKRSGESRITLSNSEKFKNILNWSPLINIENWIKEQKKMIDGIKYEQ